MRGRISARLARLLNAPQARFAKREAPGAAEREASAASGVRSFDVRARKAEA